jgi:hypothetical protein
MLISIFHIQATYNHRRGDLPHTWEAKDPPKEEVLAPSSP